MNYSTLCLLPALALACASPGDPQPRPQTTASGLQYQIIQSGKGAKVEPGKEVGVHGIGSFADGSVFWTTRETGQLFYFVTGTKSVIKGCEEGIGMMRQGDRYLFTMPPDLAYGEKGSGELIPANATLIFDYEVVSVEEPKKSIKEAMRAAIREQGMPQAIELYWQLKAEQQQDYNFRPDQLDGLAYQLLKNDPDQAIAIFQLAAREYPESYRPYEGLGDSWFKKGDKQKAAGYYRKALVIYPNNRWVLKQMQAIKAAQ